MIKVEVNSATVSWVTLVVVLTLVLLAVATTKTEMPPRSVVVTPVELPWKSSRVLGAMNLAVTVPVAMAELG